MKCTFIVKKCNLLIFNYLGIRNKKTPIYVYRRVYRRCMLLIFKYLFQKHHRQKDFLIPETKYVMAIKSVFHVFYVSREICAIL
jgi:hypothetical protein